MEIYVVGKQWMWKVQHMDGQREINELHVPVGRPVKLIMGSEDVIHSFYIPAFRVKADVIPGPLQHAVVQATKPGTYHLFCAEYCGTKHSGMIGTVIAMEPADYQAWLERRPAGGLAGRGRREAVHRISPASPATSDDAQGRGPVADGPVRHAGRSSQGGGDGRSPTRPTSASRS